MRDVIESTHNWLEQGERVAMATVVDTWGSGPRRPGAKLMIGLPGHPLPGDEIDATPPKLVGSVSGGCVENSVIETAERVLAENRSELIEFGVTDEMAWEVGLSCGGRIRIFVEPLERAQFDWWRERLVSEKAVASATVVETPASMPTEKQRALFGRRVLLDEDGERFGDWSESWEAAEDLAMQMEEHLRLGKTASLETKDGARVLLDVDLPSPVLVLVGAVHVSVALASLAKTLGYRVVVVDPRTAFASRERFPDVDQLLAEWPDAALRKIGVHRSTAIATLTHDPKLDDPALIYAVESQAFYVGALGSRRTHAKRVKRLAEHGLSEELIARIRAPIGLAIGSQSPEEIALSILAELSAARRGVLAPTLR